jgi:thiosulfate/3-mercaptopyruvate sulfurtransferase
MYELRMILYAIISNTKAEKSTFGYYLMEMKTKITLFAFIAISTIAFAFKIHSIENDPWRKDQLIEPFELAKVINDKSSKKPIIYSIGPGGNIKDNIEMGAAQEKENIDNLKIALSKLDKKTEIVIFCGCCPFEHCPNIRPAFNLVTEMKFTNYKLLNLSHNLKVDWIDKGYPMN